MSSLREAIERGRYQGYAYAYPHKTAYRPFEPPEPLTDVWAAEATDALFLYLHVPFCEMRCGFCNLFTESRPAADRPTRYVDALRRQAEVTADALGTTRYARVAIGGGTPTLLSAAALAAIFDIAEDTMGAALDEVPVAIETSPDTATSDKLALLRSRGVDRVSIGVQSFFDDEVRALGRAQKRREVERALDRIRAAELPALNIDLIYGIEGQTAQSLQASIDAAMRWRPEEIYLYPLYVRPLTGLGRSRRQWDDTRFALYRVARDRLLTHGYAQASMRMFRRTDADAPGSPVYCCQRDGMVGLGAGARSYTQALHYSFDYAVTGPQVRDLIDRYLALSSDDFRFAHFGVVLDAQEQRRRFLIQSLLSDEGLAHAAYRARFGHDAMDEFPGLRELVQADLAVDDAAALGLTPAGYALSDVIGPWLYSPSVRSRMTGFALR